MDKLFKCQEKNQSEILAKANVVSVGHGFKFKNNESTGNICLVVGVTKKIDLQSLSKSDILPKKIDDVEIDVVELGFLRALDPNPAKAMAAEFDPRSKVRPAPAGTSIGHKNITSGTFGCVVKKNNQRYILSNNHILANSNYAQIGDAVFQPGPYDGGTSFDQIAVLDDFIPLVYLNGGGNNPPASCPFAKTAAAGANVVAKTLGRSHRLVAVNTEVVDNEVDAALARPLNDKDILDNIVEIGAPAGVTDPAINMEVQKYGRTTKYTKNKIQQINATVQVSYGSSRLAQFKGQIIAGPMSDGGDSGSAVLDMSRNLVGLLFAGSEVITICCPIKKVFEKLGVTL